MGPIIELDVDVGPQIKGDKLIATKGVVNYF
jgi:hypothetical protein